MDVKRFGCASMFIVAAVRESPGRAERVEEATVRALIAD